MSSSYGPRNTGIPGASTFHRGQDFAAPSGTRIPAAADGTVSYSGTAPGYGNVVVIEHQINGEKIYTLYGHLNKPSPLNKGDAVTQGSTVGNVGHTGVGSGPHLHFEVIEDQANPLKKGHDTYNPNNFNFPTTNNGSISGNSPKNDNSVNKGGGYSDTGTSCNVPPIDKIKNKTAHSENSVVSPLILDLNGDGVKTLDFSAAVYFDQDNNGFSELSGWVDKNDALLVLDKNANGQIDSGAELFGSNTVLANGSKASNGFSALAELDANLDGKIDSSDSAFNNLRVWKDANSDGITDAGELLSLSAAGVKSINVNYSAANDATFYLKLIS